MADRVGQQFGHYRLVRLLGRGGFAEVYLGEHLRLKTQVAVKILHTSLEDDDREGFLREAQTVAHLKHPHIVRVFDFDVEDHTPYLVMDYLPKGNVRRFYPKGISLPLETIVSYVKQVASALQYAHDQKLIHRDIKPENMLLDQDDTLVLSDFGIALMAQSSRYQNTQEVAGTAAFMAPEQFQGHPHRASDQYSLGVVVYEWITGDRPFHGSFTEIASQHLFVPPPSLRERVSTISSEVEQVVLTVLEKDPHRRFGSVRAFATALEQACQAASTRPGPLAPGVSSPSQPSPPTRKAAVGISGQLPLSTNVVTPSGQLLHPNIAVTSSDTPIVSPPSVTESGLSSENQPFQPSKHHISRRAIVVGLVGLTGVSIVGGGLAWLTRSQKPQVSSLPPATAPATPSLGTTLYTYSGHSRKIRALRWSHDGSRVASASDDYTVQVWNATTGKNAIAYQGHSLYVEGVAWSPDNKHLVSGSADGTVQIWDATNGNHNYTYNGHISTHRSPTIPDHAWVNRVDWSPDGTRIVSCDQSG